MTRFIGILSFSALLIWGCSSSVAQRDLSLEKPDENRFTPVTLAEGPELDEPMAFEVLKDERVFIIERKGAVKLYNPRTDVVSTVATIDVNTKYTSAEGNVREAEEGLVGLTVHPDFENKPWVYLLYAHPDEPKHVFERWDFDGEKLVESSKKLVLEFPVQRETCCHTGGGMVWDEDENLFITVGNNTGNDRRSHTDERPGRSSWDDQRGAANTNDLRGKILRIHPEDDGTYTIPEGNMFAPGTPQTRPEIYTMGHRNAWRISIDSRTGYIYWGEVGPDASEDTEIGPRGYDELNQAREPGFFGWPYFVGENHAFPVYDYEADIAREPKDPAKPTNTSVNNTGLTELPQAQPAFISYPYGVSERFPEVGTGGRSATGGPIYHRSDFDNPARPFPAYYEGKWLAADLARGWIMAITLDENSDYVSMERFVPSYKPAEMIDIKFGPNGDLYVLEYGSRWFRDSDDDKLVRIEYNAGNRPPVVAVSADKTGGRAPMDVQLSAAGSMDYDGDELSFEWEVKPTSGGSAQQLEGKTPSVTLENNGVYTATVTATDPSGASNSASMQLVVGNVTPEVTLNVSGNADFFFPNTKVDYEAIVVDAEDGSVEDGAIKADQVAMSIDYISEGFDFAEVIQSQRSVDATARFSVAQSLIDASDCSVCHQPEVRSAGPAYKELAEKYRPSSEVVTQLAGKVLNGGTGVWGEIAMPAHPALSQNDAEVIVSYMLNYGDQTLASLPLTGSYTPVLPEDDEGRGTVILRAAYEDRGADGVPSLYAEDIVMLKSPRLPAAEADVTEGITTAVGSRGAGPVIVIPTTGAYIGFEDVDLTGVTRIRLEGRARTRDGSVGGSVDVRLDGLDGPSIGTIDVEATEFRRRPPPTATQIQQAGGNVAQRPQQPEEPDLSVELNNVSGRRSLYLIFSNETARPIDPLLRLEEVIFENQ